MSGKKTNIVLYTDQTPNGVKAAMMLEELGLDYQVHAIDISKNTQKEDWFLAINPNGRIPTLTDTIEVGGKQQQIHLAESGSILVYLAEQYDADYNLSYPKGTLEYYQVLNWLFFQASGVGPMQGQANHFVRYAPEKIKYAMDRYINETRRLYKVLDTHLEKTSQPYLVGDKCTIADIAHIGWVFWSGWAGVDIDEFPTLKEWRDRMMNRSGVKKGNDIPHPSKIKDMLEDEKAMEEYANHSSEWIMKGQETDSKE